MKRKLFVILAMIAVLGLTACGNKEEDIPSAYEIPQEEVTSSIAFAYEVTEDGSGVLIEDFFSSFADSTEIVIPKEFANLPVVKIGDGAFQDEDITSIEIPSSVTTIGEYAFSGCDIISMELPLGVTTIEKGAFYACYNLTSIKIPSSVTEIGDEVFINCLDFEKAYVEEGSYAEQWFEEHWPYLQVLYYVPGEVIGSPKSDEYYEDYVETSSYNSSAYNGAITPMSSAKVGDVVAFGSYEQDGNESNGKEEIVWYVVDKEGNKALLFSVYILDKDGFDTSNTDTFWIDSTLREWLNDEFANTAFTSDELEKIQTTQMKTVESTGSGYYDQATSTTYDKVFLMGLDELKYYFGCEGSTTDYRWEHSGDTRMYAEATPSSNMGTGTKMMTDNGTVYLHDWWLRQGSSYGHASYVSYAEVSVIGGSARSYSKGIRPVIWVNTQ